MAITNDTPAGGVTGNNPLKTPLTILDGYQVAIAVPEPFTGGTASTRGAFATKPTTTLFSVTGEVKAIVYGVVTTALAGATATVEIGVAGNTATLIPQTTATNMAVNETWYSATIDKVGAFAATSLPVANYITNSNNIIETSGTANITSGNIYYVCLWTPISPNGMVKAVSPGRVN